MAAPQGTLLNRLAQLRDENRIGRMVPGLGASNVGWLRRTGAGGQSVSASVGTDPVAALRAGAALNRLDVSNLRVQMEATAAARRAEMTAQRAMIEAHNARTAAESAKRTAKQALGSGTVNSGTSAVDRVRQRRTSFGRMAAKAGRGVANPLLGMRMMLGSAAGRAFIYTHVAGAAANGVVDLALQVRQARQETASPGEFRRLAANQLAGGALGIFGVRNLASGVNRMSALLSGGDVEEAERQFERRWRETFTSREDAARMGIARRSEIARLRAEGDKAIAQVGAYLRDYTPKTFTIATIDDREIYRRELFRGNLNDYNDTIGAIRNGVAKAVRELP